MGRGAKSWELEAGSLELRVDLRLEFLDSGLGAGSVVSADWPDRLASGRCIPATPPDIRQ